MCCDRCRSKNTERSEVDCFRIDLPSDKMSLDLIQVAERLSFKGVRTTDDTVEDAGEVDSRISGEACIFNHGSK